VNGVAGMVEEERSVVDERKFPDELRSVEDLNVVEERKGEEDIVVDVRKGEG
jgi:hypothetical protein